MKQKNPIAYALGKMSSEKRFKGKTKEEISAHMRLVRAGKKSSEIAPLTSVR